MNKTWLKFEGRLRRHKRIRRRVSGTKSRPRLSVYRSLNHLYAQLIDDENNKTMLSLSTVSKEIKEQFKKDSGNVKGALALGAAFAESCKKIGVTSVVFDRSGYSYHGRIKALAEAARKGGLEF